MAWDERKKELLTKINDAVVAYDEETYTQLCNAFLDERTTPKKAL